MPGATMLQEHSAACLMKLASLPYTGATSVFLKVLLNKRYALPNRIVDHVVDHFMQMVRVPGPLPVVWHQVGRSSRRALVP